MTVSDDVVIETLLQTAANDFIRAFEAQASTQAHVKAVKGLVEHLGGNYDVVESTESPFAICAYFVALVVRYEASRK